MLPKTQKKIFVIIGAIFEKWTPDSWKKNVSPKIQVRLESLPNCNVMGTGINLQDHWNLAHFKSWSHGSPNGFYWRFCKRNFDNYFGTNLIIDSVKILIIVSKKIKRFRVQLFEKCFFFREKIFYAVSDHEIWGETGA